MGRMGEGLGLDRKEGWKKVEFSFGTDYSMRSVHILPHAASSVIISYGLNP